MRGARVNFSTLDRQKQYWDSVSPSLVGPISALALGKWIRKLHPEPLSGRILDHGCGIGRVYEAIGRPSNYIGVDISDKYLEIFRARHPEATIIKLSSWELPFLPKYFDHIISFSVFTHFDVHQMTFMLGEFNRVLKLNGEILLTIFRKEEVKRPVGNWKTISRNLFSRLLDVLGFEIINEVLIPESGYHQDFILAKKRDNIV